MNQVAFSHPFFLPFPLPSVSLRQGSAIAQASLELLCSWGWLWPSGSTAHWNRRPASWLWVYSVLGITPGVLRMLGIFAVRVLYIPWYSNSTRARKLPKPAHCTQRARWKSEFCLEILEGLVVRVLCTGRDEAFLLASWLALKILFSINHSSKSFFKKSFLFFQGIPQSLCMSFS